MMETASLTQPAPWATSRYTKALPDPPPPPASKTKAVVVLPARKDSLASSRPPPPPKDTAAKTSSTMAAAKVSESPLPPLPGLTRVNSPPVVIRRKPVGNGAVGNTAQSPPHPQPAQPGNVSPVESLSSIFSAYGTEDSSATRYSEDTTATAYSVMGPSPPNPKVLPKDTLGGPSTKLDLVSPLYLPTPVSSEMSSNAPHPQHGSGLEAHTDGRPPTPPTKEIQRPITPKSSKALPSIPSEQANISSPMAEQSPSQPQLWRRRSLKSDKPLTVPQLKLTSSHGSTAASAQEAGALQHDIASLPKPRAPFAGSALDSPILKGFQSFPGRNVRPSPSNKALPRNPRPEIMENPNPQEHQDGFSQYAQEVEDGYKASSSEAAPAVSPHIQRPPTPEYDHDESPIDGSFPNMRSPASPASPVTPPTEGRPLSIIPEDIVRAVAAPAPAAPPPSGPLPSLPPRSSSRGPPPPGGGSGPRLGLPRSPAPPGRSSPGAFSPAAPSPASVSPAVIAPAEVSSKAPATSSPPPASVAKMAASLSPGYVQSPSSTPTPSIAISDDGDASTIKAARSPHPTQPDHEATKQQPQHQLAPSSSTEEEEVVDAAGPTVPASPGEANYFPAAEYSRLFFPGDIIPAPPIKASQLDCLTAHSRFVASKNEHHPVACMTCKVEDNGARFCCSHCRVRICGGCREALVSNGRDLAKIMSSK
ncbi:hypothetical protein KVR01_008445 [Diaporthe batatas]|uniref:uncharacterized protein n=1 Tax=Diaporthe batatas TaxID=748121 RepID=UPI001D04D2D1|nr:uncharacterized protein KVR01_008445 [Diaporthe batatas]KAG8161458.1 hypothetical protein KVR01_008445 [Diaporthe batatas]